MGVGISSGTALNIGLFGRSSPKPPIPAQFVLNHKSIDSAAITIARSITILITTIRYVAITVLTANDCCCTSIAATFHPQTSKKSKTAPFNVWSSINSNTCPTLPSGSGSPEICSCNIGTFSALGIVNSIVCIVTGRRIRSAVHKTNRPRYFFNRSTWVFSPVFTRFSCGSRDRNLSRENAIKTQADNKIVTLAQRASASLTSVFSRNSMEAPATAVARGYHRNSRKVTSSKRWKSLRLQTLRRDEFQCKSCGARGRLEVDHINPVRTHPELAFELANLQALCAACHSRKTRIECGFKPPSQERLAWCEAVNQLSKKEVKPCSQA